MNPILPGFHPDPSVCRVGDDYYLVNSTFEFFPGIPVYHSRDLIHWTLVCHCLTRDSQIDLNRCKPSGGIWAPTIRWKNGVFYVVVTDASRMFGGGDGNFYVYTNDLSQPWSDPVEVQQTGIDPSLLFDDDGKCYLTTNGAGGIWQSELEIETGHLLTEPKPIWPGTGGRCPEGPHLYHIDKWYYLMIAEGGTEYGHMETVVRSRSPWGPWETDPNNPILTQRDKSDDELQCAGHADLVETAEGRWYAVYLAARTVDGNFHHLGRETFLARVDWANRWPVMTPMDVQLPPENSRETFAVSISPHWMTVRSAKADHCLSGDGLVLLGCGDGLDDMNPTVLLRRQEHFDMVFSCTLTDAQLGKNGEAGVVVYYDLCHYYAMGIVNTPQGRRLRLTRVVEDMRMLAADLEAPEGAVEIGVSSDRRTYRFIVNGQVIATACTRLLSSEVMSFSFTGVMLGMYAAGEGTRACFTECSYRSGTV